jgi:hypothetical protein
MTGIPIVYFTEKRCSCCGTYLTTIRYPESGYMYDMTAPLKNCMVSAVNFEYHKLHRRIIQRIKNTFEDLGELLAWEDL